MTKPYKHIIKQGKSNAKKDEKKERLSFRVNPEIARLLAQRGEETGRTQTQIVEDALRLWMEKPETERICEVAAKNAHAASISAAEAAKRNIQSTAGPNDTSSTPSETVRKGKGAKQ